jgi:hypothetical protein
MRHTVSQDRAIYPVSTSFYGHAWKDVKSLQWRPLRKNHQRNHAHNIEMYISTSLPFSNVVILRACKDTHLQSAHPVHQHNEVELSRKKIVYLALSAQFTTAARGEM